MLNRLKRAHYTWKLRAGKHRRWPHWIASAVFLSRQRGCNLRGSTVQPQSSLPWPQTSDLEQAKKKIRWQTSLTSVSSSPKTVTINHTSFLVYVCHKALTAKSIKPDLKNGIILAMEWVFASVVLPGSYQRAPPSPNGQTHLWQWGRSKVKLGSQATGQGGAQWK